MEAYQERKKKNSGRKRQQIWKKKRKRLKIRQRLGIRLAPLLPSSSSTLIPVSSLSISLQNCPSRCHRRRRRLFPPQNCPSHCYHHHRRRRHRRHFPSLFLLTINPIFIAASAFRRKFPLSNPFFDFPAFLLRRVDAIHADFFVAALIVLLRLFRRRLRRLLISVSLVNLVLFVILVNFFSVVQLRQHRRHGIITREIFDVSPPLTHE